MSIAEKIIKASENVSKVYEAGRSSVVDESKLIPQNVSGAYISLDDVSEIPHKVECKVSSGSVAPETVRVIKFGKNLIPYPFKDFTPYSNGITATDLGDGGVLLNGTATATTYIHLHKTNIGNRYITGKDGRNGIFFANKYNENIWVEHHNTNHLTYVVINKGAVCDNIVFYPQIEVGAKETEFEKGIPYEVFTPSADGIVEGMTSASPYINLFCNTADVTLDVAYNKSYGMYKCEQTHEAIKEEGIAEGKQAEYDSFWDAFQDYGKKTTYAYAFYHTNWNDANFKPKYDIVPENAPSMFFWAQITDLVGILKRQGVKLDFSKCTNMMNAFYYLTKVTELGVIDMSSATDIRSTFIGCRLLQKIEKIVMSETTGLQHATSTFNDCSALEEVYFEGVIACSIDLRWSTKLSKESIVSLINILSTTTTDKTLSLSKTAVNTAFGIDVDDETTYPKGSEYYTLRHSKDNWTFSYV